MVGARSRAIRSCASNKGGNGYMPRTVRAKMFWGRATPDRAGARPYRVQARITFLAHPDSLRAWDSDLRALGVSFSGQRLPFLLDAV